MRKSVEKAGFETPSEIRDNAQAVKPDPLALSEEKMQRNLYPIFVGFPNEMKKTVLNVLKKDGKSNKWIPKPYRYIP